MMNKYFTGGFLSSSLTGGTEDLFAGAVKTDDGLNVMLVNRGSLPQTFNFDFNKSYNLNSCSYITAASNEADNFQVVNKNTGYTDIDKQEITCVYDKAENAADIKSYTVSPYTVMFLNLKEVKNKPCPTTLKAIALPKAITAQALPMKKIRAFPETITMRL